MNAYLDCRRSKRTSHAALAFELDLERNLWALYEDLRSGAYRPGPSICFIAMWPRPREVWAASFRDRVVHHLLYARVAPRFERAFIWDSCACIPGRGTDYAGRRLAAKVRSITRNWTHRALYLKCDIRNFFVSIDRRILAELLCGRIAEPWWRELALLILWHDCRAGAEVQSPAEHLALVPEPKSLWAQPQHLGLPIGNLSSQFFANVYLDVLDQHVKHRMRARHYVRYVDDLILLHEDPRQLLAWRDEISRVLQVALRLDLNHGKTVLQPLERGVDCVGLVVKPHRTVLRRRTVRTSLHRLAQMPQPEFSTAINSYFGLFRRAPASHGDRAELARLAMTRGLVVNRALTKAFPTERRT